mmetsp:Transcript_23848/g.34980  ORF Transcript_23848/g.34980 Transcript_23848/m.34980 type:complete len:124 (-) Transcript_23848:174-545(-)
MVSLDKTGIYLLCLCFLKSATSSPTPAPTILETIPCLNCYTLDPTSAPTYMTYGALGVSINSEALRVLSVLLILVVAAVLVTYIGYVRSSYNKYGEVQVKRRNIADSSTHSQMDLIEKDDGKP